MKTGEGDTMKISVEVSLYPLSDDYLPVIQQVVKRLNAATNVKVKTNGMSTQLTGEFAAVMALLEQEIKTTFDQSEKAVFVAKFLNTELDLE